MQIQCVICADIISHCANGGDVAALSCGHVFHGLCIRTWFDRSTTCPHCRAKITKGHHYKIFFTLAAEPDGQDSITLTRTVDNLKYELRLKNMECSKLSEGLETYKKRSAGLVKEVQKLEQNITSVAEATLQLNEQRKYASSKAKELSQAKCIIQSLENELQQYQTLKAMVNNSHAGADFGVDIKSLDSTQLSFLLQTFKKDITRLSRTNENVKQCLARTENEKITLASKIRELQEEIQLKDRVVDTLKDTCSEFKKKFNIENKGSNDSVEKLNESLAESRSPTSSKRFVIPKINRKDEKYLNSDEAPKTSHDKEKRIKLSSTSNQVLNIFPNFNQSNQFRITSDRLNSLSQASSIRSLDDDLRYDGMGGHSRVDYFPSANRPKLGMTKANKFLSKKRKL